MNLIDFLDTRAETTPLSDDDRRILRKANDDLSKLRRDEETKWAQRAKVKHVQEGENNTKYFHLIANGIHRRKKIFQLEEEEGIILGQDNLKNFISEFYKNLFGPPSPNHFPMLESVNNDIPQLFPAEIYQKIWEVIKSDLMAMFDAFQRHELPLYHLNFGTIILLSKKETAIQIQ
jgi:mannosylglycoprotein endo-beta-mannosidase